MPESSSPNPEPDDANRSSDERFRAVLDNSLDAAYRRDLRTDTYDYISPVIERLTGFSADAFSHMPTAEVLERIHPEDRARVSSAIERMATDADAGILEYRFCRADGRYVWLADHFQVMRDEEGRPCYRIGIVRDVTERRQTDAERERLLEEVARRAAELDATFASLADGVIIYDTAGRRRYTNAAAERILQSTPVELAAMTLEERMQYAPVTTGDGTPLRLAENPVTRALGGELIHGMVLVYHRPAGDVWLSVSAAPIRDPEGNLYGAVASLTDITALHAAETALRESEHRYRELFETMQEAFFVAEIITDATGTPVDWRYLEANPQHERYMGRAHGQLIGHTYVDIVPHPDPVWITTIGTVALTRVPISTELFSPFRQRWLQVNAYSPRPGQAAVLFSDIHERKVAEEEREHLLDEVQHRAAELNAIFSSMADGLVVNAEDGRVVMANPAAQRLLDMPPDRWALPFDVRWRGRQIYTPTGQSLPANDFPARRAMRGETVQTQVLRVVIAGKPEVWLAVGAAPIRLPSGEIRGAVTIFVDVTAYHALLEEDRRLLHTVAHDLRSPVTIINGQLQLLMDLLAPHLTDRVQENVTALQRALRRMSVMIDDLTEVTNRDARHLLLHRQPVQLAAFLPELLARQRDSLESARITMDLPADLPPVHADPYRLGRIFSNLLINAQKYSAPDTLVRVTARREQGEVLVTISDRGVGIPPDDLPHIFDRFFRSSYQRKGEGIGLGLYITKALVEAHGGRIWAESTLGEGSTFYVVLPITPPATGG